MDRKLQAQFEEDTRAFLDLLVSPGPLPPSHVRIVASAVLRKWLVDGRISDLARMLNVTFTLPVLDTAQVAEAISEGADITSFMAGGVAMDGVPIRGFYVSDSEFEGTPPISISDLHWADVPPGRFLRAKRVYHAGKWFNSEQILRFVGNKYGGVHYDTKREKEWQAQIEQASSFFTLGNPDRLKLNEPLLEEQREPEHRFRLVLPREIGHEWTCLDVEVLAMAQSLVNVRCDGEPLLVLEDPTS